MGTMTKQVPPVNALIVRFLFRQEVFQFPQLAFGLLFYALYKNRFCNLQLKDFDF